MELGLLNCLILLAKLLIAKCSQSHKRVIKAHALKRILKISNKYQKNVNNNILVNKKHKETKKVVISIYLRELAVESAREGVAEMSVVFTKTMTKIVFQLSITSK